jgi:hypothetical protein
MGSRSTDSFPDDKTSNNRFCLASALAQNLLPRNSMFNGDLSGFCFEFRLLSGTAHELEQSWHLRSEAGLL